MGILFDQGLFKYDDKVSKHWPEFGQNGKDNITISEVLRHESGLAWFTESIPSIKNAWHENIKKNQLGINSIIFYYSILGIGSNVMTVVNFHCESSEIEKNFMI